MPKFRMKYRPPVEGEKIPISEATYQSLKVAAFHSRCTIGQWCETHLRTHLRLQTNYSTPKAKPASPAPRPRERHFEINPALFIEIEMYAKERGKSARQWIAGTVLYCLAIEVERLRGARLEPDRFG